MDFRLVLISHIRVYSFKFFDCKYFCFFFNLPNQFIFVIVNLYLDNVKIERVDITLIFNGQLSFNKNFSMLGWIISQLVIHCASHKISSLHEIQKPYYRKLRSTFLILNFNYLFFIHLNGIKAHQYLHMITFQTCKQVVLETRQKS